MRKLIVSIFIISIIFILTADMIEYTFSIPQPEIENYRDLISVTLDETQQLGEPGTPALPYYGLKFLLPQGHSASDLKIIKQNKTLLAESALLTAVQPQYPLSTSNKAEYVKADIAYYNSLGTQPATPFHNLSTQYYSGYCIAFFAVTPLEYNPITQRSTGGS